MRRALTRNATLSPALTPADPEPCVTCGAPVTTKFCPNCGEMRASERSHSVVEFMREHVLEAVLSLDGKVLRTVKMVLLKPGELTAAFMRGSRTPYLPPLQAFLLFNVVFFFTNSGVLDYPLRQQLGAPWRHTAQLMVMQRIQQLHIDYSVFAAKYNAVNSAQARSLVILMVPAFAIAVGLLTANKRRPLVQHLVYALHTYCFFFIGLPIVLWVIGGPLYFALNKLFGPISDDPVLSLLAMLSLTVYLGLSSRRAYAVSKLQAVAIALLGAFGIVQIMSWYRHLLLYVTLRSM